MAKKILNVATFGLAGGLLSKKKPKEAAATPAQPASNKKGPIITPLGSSKAPLPNRVQRIATILSDKLGG